MKVATEEDLEDIYTMAMKFIDSIDYKDYSTEEDILMLIIAIINGNPLERIILVEPGKGFLAGMASKFPFGPKRIATEIAWWVNPEERKSGLGLELLKAFEFWAKEKAGCSMVTMVGLDKGLDKLYTKEGYKLYERAYMKAL